MFRLPVCPTVLHLVPSAHAVRRAHPAGAVALTMPALVQAFDVPAPDARPRLSRFVTRWLVERAVHDAGSPTTAKADASPNFGGPRGGQVEAMVEALRRLRELAVTPRMLARACGSAGVDDDVARALAAYNARLGRLGAEDASAAARCALDTASRAAWPAPLQQIRRVVVDEGVEVVGLTYALVEAMAQSGRTVVVRMPGQSEHAGATAYADAIQTSLEASEAAGLEIRERSEGDDAGDAAVVDHGSGAAPPPLAVVRLPHGRAAIDRLAFEVRELVQGGTAPHRIGVVLPGSVRPYWWRAQGVVQLRHALSEGGIPSTAGQSARVHDFALGRCLLDAVALAGELAGGGASVSLGAWGRLAAACWAHGTSGPAATAGAEDDAGDGSTAPSQKDDSSVAADSSVTPAPPMPPTPWVGRHADERIAPDALAAWLRDARGMRMDLAGEAAAHAQRILRRTTAGILAALDMPTLLAELARLLDELAAASTAPEQYGEMRELFVDWQRGWAAFAVLAGSRDDVGGTGQASAQADAPAAYLPFLLRSILRERLRPEADQQGVAILRDEDVCRGVWQHVLIAGADEAIFFAPRRPNAYLSDSLGRAIRRMGGPFVGPAAGILQDRPPSLRDRPQWLWQRASTCAGERVVAALLLPEGAEEALDAVTPAPGRGLGADDGQSPEALAPVALLPLAVQPTLHALRRAAAAQGMLEAAPAPTTLHAYLQARWRPLVPTAAPTLSAPLAQRLAEQWRAREHSASSLDELGRCRYRYAAHYVLGLQERVRPDVVAARPLLGTAMHAALRDALAELAASPLRLPSTAEAKELWLQEAQRRYWRREREYLPVGSVHVHLRGPTLVAIWAAARVQLEQWLDSGDVRAVYVEAAFGGSARWPALRLPWPLGGRDVAVRGAIDRIDVADAAVRVVDYKSTEPRRAPRRHLQLPAYALVALRETGPTRQVEAAWLTLLGKDAGKKVPAVDLPSSQGELMRQYTGDVIARAKPFLAGEWTLDPENDKACQSCSFVQLCQQNVVAGADEPLESSD